jgi:hypothetical protein
MIATVASLLLRTGLSNDVADKAAKPLLIAVLFLLALGLFGVGKCSYDRRIISAHNARQDAANAKADRRADQKAADQRVTDVNRANAEQSQIQQAIDEARRTGADPRAAYYECVRRQQAARRAGQPPVDC